MDSISVIVPVYKVEAFLSRCVDSILAQTFPDFELILVDDGSPDRCGEMCDAYAVKDPRIHVIHQKNGGLSAARNAGIDWVFAHSDSQWLTFIDSDDWVHSQYLELLYQAAVGCGVSVAACGYTVCDAFSPLMPAPSDSVEVYSPEAFFCQARVNFTIACGKLYRKDCFLKARYPIGKIHEDEFLTHRILFPLQSIAVLPDALYYYYQNEDGITKSSWSPKRLDAIEAFDAQLSYLQEHGFTSAEALCKLHFAEALHKQLLEIRACHNAAWAEYHALLKRRLRKLLRENRREIPVKTYPWLYESAFPRLMWLYWLVRARMPHKK